MKSLILAVLLFSVSAKADTIYSTSEKTFKLIPAYGIMTLKTDYENFNAKVNTGVALEKMLSSRFSLGLLFNYASFKFNDSNYYGYNNTPYTYGYYNYGYFGQSIKSEIFSFGMNSKFFVIDQGILRPFLGGGLTYNRNNLKYDYANSSYNYYNNQYSTNVDSFSGLLMAGTEFRFSRDFGLNFDFKYIRTLGNNSDYYYSNSNLESLGKAMENSDLMSFNFGLLIAI